MCQENYFIEQVMRVVRNASNLMTAGITIEQKGNESNYVTSADINVQCYLEEQLTLLIPDSTFLGEESASDIMKSEYMWVVDPIDGTTAKGGVLGRKKFTYTLKHVLIVHSKEKWCWS